MMRFDMAQVIKLTAYQRNALRYRVDTRQEAVLANPASGDAFENDSLAMDTLRKKLDGEEPVELTGAELEWALKEAGNMWETGMDNARRDPSWRAYANSSKNLLKKLNHANG